MNDTDPEGAAYDAARDRRAYATFVAQEQDRRLVAAEALLNRFQAFFAGPCRADHDGACQEHMGEGGCTVEGARKWLQNAWLNPVGIAAMDPADFVTVRPAVECVNPAHWRGREVGSGHHDRTAHGGEPWMSCVRPGTFHENPGSDV